MTIYKRRIGYTNMRKSHYQVVLDVFVKSDDDFDPTKNVNKSIQELIDLGCEAGVIEDDDQIFTSDIQIKSITCTDSR